MYLTCITITQSTIVTGPIGFNIGLTNVNARLSNVVSTLYQRCVTLFRRCVTLFRHCFNVGHWRCINIVQRWKSDIGFCFIFNVGSTLFQLWSTTLKRRWSDVGMLPGMFLILKSSFFLTFPHSRCHAIEILGARLFTKRKELWEEKFRT